MSSYTFTAPTGEKYTVDVPNGVSQAEAQAAFNKELNSGALKNIGIGQSLSGLGKAASQAQSAVAGLGNLPVPTAADFKGFVAKAGQAVSPAQVLQQLGSPGGAATKAIGSIAPAQVNGMLAQASAAVGQAATVMSLDKGVGKFGLTPQQLEQQGFLKPGTVQQFISTTPGADFTKVLANPAVWSGKDGVTNVNTFLASPNIQSLAQSNLMSQGLDKMKSLGLATGKESAGQLSALVQGAAAFGAGAMAAWSKGMAPPDIAGAINNLAKGAQFAVDMVASKLPKAQPNIAGAVKTVERAGVDSSLNAALGDPKVPPLTYGPIQREEEAPDPNQPPIDKFKDTADKFLQRINFYQQEAQDLVERLVDLEAGIITRGEWNLVNDQLQSLRTRYNAEIPQGLGKELIAAYEALPGSIKPDYRPQYESLARLAGIVSNFVIYLKKRIADDEQLIGT